VADNGNHTIRKITPTGLVTTVAGLPGTGDLTDGTGILARFNQPYGIAVDSSGVLYVGDSANSVVRKGVRADPKIVIALPTPVVASGTTLSLTASVSGVSPSLQWQLNGTNIAGATNASLVISNAQASGIYTLMASNIYGAASNSF